MVRWCYSIHMTTTHTTPSLADQFWTRAHQSHNVPVKACPVCKAQAIAAGPQPGDTIEYRQHGARRYRTATVVRVLDDGRLWCRAYHRAARGGMTVPSMIAVRPNQVRP